MNHVSVVEAVKFGFDKSIKKFFFFIGTFIVAGLVWLGCFLLSGLLAAPFFIPAASVVKQIIAIFKTSAVMQAQQALGGALTQVAELLSKSPSAFVFALIGVFIFVMLLWAFTTMIALGMIKIFLDIYDKGHSTLSNLFVRPIYIFRAVIVSILYSFIVGAPFLVPALAYKFSPVLALVFLFPAIIVAIYFTLKLFYSNYFVIDKGLGSIGAIKSSWALSGAPLKLLLFWLLLVVIGILVYIPPSFFNLLNTYAPHTIWTILIVISHIVMRYFLGVITVMGYAYLYRRLSSRSV